MAGFRSWLFISAGKFNSETLFTYEVMRENFQSDFDSYSQKLYTGVIHNDPMIFKCNQQGYPDLPEWLRFIQRRPSENGFLYGTPTTPGKTFIEIYAINKNSYDTARDLLVIKAVPEKMLPYQAEFFIELREVEKVLPSSVQSEIKQDLQKLWNNEALEIVNITNALDRGGRVPLPLAGHYEGVYVKVGSKKYFSRCLQKVVTPEYQRQCAAGDKVKVPGECHFCKIPSNCITWCGCLFPSVKTRALSSLDIFGLLIMKDILLQEDADAAMPLAKLLIGEFKLKIIFFNQMYVGLVFTVACQKQKLLHCNTKRLCRFLSKASLSESIKHGLKCKTYFLNA
uniref:Sarcoglycan, alpha n=1 Tax=Poecilia reticulata TaxID=8081 RepID=A0A3P9NZK8_POERE